MEGIAVRTGPGRPLALVLPVIVKGTAQLGGELVSPPSPARVISPSEGRQILAELRSGGVQWVYGVPSPAWPEVLLRELGFHGAFDVGLRNFNLSLSGISSKFDDPLRPLRRVAKLARRIRQKLLEVELRASWLAYAARLFEQRRPELGFAIDRTEQFFEERVLSRAEARGYRLLVLRRQAGVGLDGYAVIRLIEQESGKRHLLLVDHWTRIAELRSTAWLLGELALWGLSEHVDVIQAFAPGGSPLDRVLYSAGCIKRASAMPFFHRSLVPGQETRTLSVANVELRAVDLDRF